VDAPATSGLRVSRWFCYLKYGTKTKKYDEEIAEHAKDPYDAEKNPNGKKLSKGAWAKHKMDANIKKKSLCIRAVDRATEIQKTTEDLNKKIDSAMEKGKNAATVYTAVGQKLQDLEITNAGLEYDNAITTLCREAPQYTEAVQEAKKQAEDAAAAMAAAAAESCIDMGCEFLTNLSIGIPCAFVISFIDEGLVTMCIVAVMFEAMFCSWLMIDCFPFHPQTGVPLFVTVPSFDEHGNLEGKPAVHWKKLIVCCRRNFDSDGKRLPSPTGNGWVAYLDPQKACCAAAPLTRAILVFVGLFILFLLPILEGSTAMFCTGPFFDRVRKVINGPKYMGIMTSESMPKGYWLSYAKAYAKQHHDLDLDEYLNEDTQEKIHDMVTKKTKMTPFNGGGGSGAGGGSGEPTDLEEQLASLDESAARLERELAAVHADKARLLREQADAAASVEVTIQDNANGESAL